MSIQYVDSYDGSKDEMYQMMDVTQPQFDTSFQFTLPRLTTSTTPTIVDSTVLFTSPVGVTGASSFSPSISPFTGRSSVTSDYFSHSPYSVPSICGEFSDDADLTPPEKRQWYTLF